MKAIALESGDRPASLIEVPRPDVGEDEILIAVRAASVVLPMDVARAAVVAGWAQVHPAVPLLGLPENRLMLFGPRDDQELEVVYDLLLEAYRYAGGRS